MPHTPHALHCPTAIPSAVFTDPQAALEQVQALYGAAIAHLRDKLGAFIAGTLPPGRVRACYPVVRVRIDSVARPDSRLAYGFVAAPGLYETTLTRPDLYADY
ncbi:MAG: AMP nucleosidase, partial [Burkholderiaceae bacterium]|nr:AMP nucleosidase [Burkholderiaceae bacterium]